jgi:hypothetical protein
MSTSSSHVRLWARFLSLKLANLCLRLAQLFTDIAASLKGGRGPKSGQRRFLLRDLRLVLESAVEDAERHAISDEDANQLSLLRSLIRWLENGELPEPAVIPYLEKQRGGIHRRADQHEVPSARRSSQRSTSSEAMVAPLRRSIERATPTSAGDSRGRCIDI